MRIEALKYRTEDKNDIIIYVEFLLDYSKSEWRIADIKYKSSRQKTYRYYSDTFKDSYNYRLLGMEDRRKYAYEKFEEFVGRDKLEEAIMSAWESFKPNLEEIIGGHV